MMYQAMRTISQSLKDGSVRLYQPGALIEDFETWTYVTRKALLDHGKVITVSDIAVEPTVGERVLAVSVAPTVGSTLVCEHCPDKAFASVQGLKLHNTRMHPEG